MISEVIGVYCKESTFLMGVFLRGGFIRSQYAITHVRLASKPMENMEEIQLFFPKIYTPETKHIPKMTMFFLRYHLFQGPSFWGI